MIYTKEALEAAKLKVIGNPTVEEQAYINGWNDALDAVINNCGTDDDIPMEYFESGGR